LPAGHPAGEWCLCEMTSDSDEGSEL
jgi:hypothetical protein